MTDQKEIFLDNTPNSNALWRGLGGNFDSLTQIINEFIDNSLSDFIKHNQSEIKKILIRIEQKAEERYGIQIEDTGAGIDNISAAFSIGDKSGRESSLNEHGFGLKHALAAANPDNNNWSVLTRTNSDVEEDVYYEVSSPFDISRQKAVKHIKSGNWPGIRSTGTIVNFEVSSTLLKTIARGLQGNYRLLDSLMKILAEDLGYIYGSYISDNKASVSIRYKTLENKDYTNIDISEVKPNYNDTIVPGIGTTRLNLGNGEVDIEYKFLQAEPSQYLKYYKANLATSGVEIRLNGRLLEKNLFTEIWGNEKHNSFNYILIQLNVKSDEANRLPMTTTNKTGLRQDDPKLERIYDWIRSKLPEPKRKASLARDEVDLFNQLKDRKEKVLKDYDPSLVIERESLAFTSVDEKIRIDLYQSFQNKVTIYEGKKNKTSPQDVYQLMMYWDGLVMDNVTVDEGILIAPEHPKSVEKLVEIKNSSKDQNGNYYNIKLKTWQQESVDYPN